VSEKAAESARRSGWGSRFPDIRSCSVRITGIVQSEMPLRVFRHVGDANRTPHERRPGLLGRRLKKGEIPELPLFHDDFRHAVVEHPALSEVSRAWSRSANIDSGMAFFICTFPWLILPLSCIAHPRDASCVASAERARLKLTCKLYSPALNKPSPMRGKISWLSKARRPS
jgi:hypothetical protein